VTLRIDLRSMTAYEHLVASSTYQGSGHTSDTSPMCANHSRTRWLLWFDSRHAGSYPMDVQEFQF